MFLGIRKSDLTENRRRDILSMEYFVMRNKKRGEVLTGKNSKKNNITNNEITDFILDNVQKIILPEEIIKLELSLSRFELVALMLAERSKNVTMSKLAQGMSIPMSTATGIVDRLVKKGLFQRGSSAEDRRIVTVSLTEKGKQIVKDVNKHFRVFLDRIRSILTEEEFEKALKIMQKVIMGMQKNKTGDVKKAGLRARSINIEIE